jgi:glycine oxidase
VVVAAGAWTSLIDSGDRALPAGIEPIRGQMLEFRPEGRLFARVIYTPRGYVIPRHDGRVIAGSTSEHAGFVKEVTPEGLTRIEQIANEISAMLTAPDVSRSWAGLRPFAPDGLPVLGGVDGVGGLFVATGHYRNGILLAPLTARLMADTVIDGSTSPLLEQFGMGRFRQQAAGVA